jgi:hypothetical protein
MQGRYEELKEIDKLQKEEICGSPVAALVIKQR